MATPGLSDKRLQDIRGAVASLVESKLNACVSALLRSAERSGVEMRQEGAVAIVRDLAIQWSDTNGAPVRGDIVGGGAEEEEVPTPTTGGGRRRSPMPSSSMASHQPGGQPSMGDDDSPVPMLALGHIVHEGLGGAAPRPRAWSGGSPDDDSSRASSAENPSRARSAVRPNARPTSTGATERDQRGPEIELSPGGMLPPTAHSSA
eukprot:Hpha_TRINITY_DN35534_c0_g1::TRINITY_DN35534_c0_g1_i1::g.84486::m.84486